MTPLDFEQSMSRVKKICTYIKFSLDIFSYYLLVK